MFSLAVYQQTPHLRVRPQISMLPVLYEDNHLLVINKPAAVATMGAESGPTVHSLAGEYLKKKYSKPGNVYVGIVSRLDAMTTGVLIVARTSKAASRLTPQFAPKDAARSASGKRKQPAARADKIYLAVVEGSVDGVDSNHSPESLVDWVRKDDQARRMRVVDENAPDAQRAELAFVKLGTTSIGNRDATVLAVRLKSGRKHQIRVQFANRGIPVWADRKYGGVEKLTKGIGLHSYLLRVDHPTQKKRLEWTASTPNSWRVFHDVLPHEQEIRETVTRAFQLPRLLTNDST